MATKSTGRKKKPGAIDAFLALSDEEKEAVYRSFDKEVIADSVPTTKADLARWKRFTASARRGRPKIGAGAERVNVSIERTLLRQADSFAKGKGLTRAQLVARGLRLALKAG